MPVCDVQPYYDGALAVHTIGRLAQVNKTYSSSHLGTGHLAQLFQFPSGVLLSFQALHDVAGTRTYLLVIE